LGYRNPYESQRTNAQILGINSPWQVADVDLALAKGEVTVRIKLVEGVKLCCPT
jgi:hypothetical protein